MSGPSASTRLSPSRPLSIARLRFGDCEICRQTRILWRAGHPQPIRRKAFDVLLLLIDQRPQTLSHERIATEVWGSKSLSPKHVARAVMDARRDIGDDAESPKYLLSVRGVGYRFAAEITQIQEGGGPDADAVDADAQAARADIDAAAVSLRLGDFGEARRLVDRAIDAADLAGARPELARALSLAAAVVLRVGTHERALGLATRAMRVAQNDGRSDVIADARLGLAEVQLWMGSAHAALDNLLAVHRMLAASGPSFALWRCESNLSKVYRQIGRLEEAWPWCEQAQASALLLEPHTRALRERLIKVAVLHYMIESAEADGRHDDLQGFGRQALDLLDGIEPDARDVGSQAFELVSQSYRAVTLEAMGRVEEGWRVIDRLRPLLFGPGVVSTPWLELRRKEFREVEAGLLSRSGRAIEAIQLIEAANASASNPGSLMDPSLVQGQAARICERVGRYKEALEWMRRQQRSVNRVFADRAQSTAGIVRVQLESDRLGEDLAQARAEVQRLKQLNFELERRIAQMDRHPLLDEGGLVPVAALTATIDGRAALAREREMPLCVGVVEALDGGEAEEGEGAADLSLRRQLKLLTSTLKAVIPEASAAAQWRPGLYIFLIADLGLGPSRRRCQALAERLSAEMQPTTGPHPHASFRAEAVDITRFIDIEAALVEAESRRVPT